MKKTVIACLLGILAWNVRPAAAQTQGWRVWYDMNRSSELVNLLPSPDGGVVLVARFDTTDERGIPFVSQPDFGTRLLAIDGQAKFAPSFSWRNPRELNYQRESNQLWSIGEDIGPCGTPPHNYYFWTNPPRLGKSSYANFTYNDSYSYRNGTSYQPVIDESRLWPGAKAEATAYLLHPNGSVYIAANDELLKDTLVENTNGWPHFRSLLLLRTSLIFDIETIGDSMLALATSSGLIRTDLEGNIRDTLMAGTAIRRIERLVAGQGWLLEAWNELIRLDETLNPLARWDLETDEMTLRSWALADREIAVLASANGSHRLLRCDLILNELSSQTLPASLTNPRYVAYLNGQPVLAGKWSLPPAEGFSTCPSISWFAWRDAANAPAADFALSEMKAERVQRRENDYTFDLMARVENQSGQPLDRLGFRVNLTDHQGKHSRWSGLHLPEAIPAGGSAWVRIERLSASYSGPTPNELSASVCLQIDLGNGQPDPQPADNARCQDLRLQYTSAAGRLHAEPLRLQPNPTSGRFRLTGLADNVRDFWLTDACGRTVRVEPSARFAGGCEFVLESRPAGVYQLHAGSAEKPLRLVLID